MSDVMVDMWQTVADAFQERYAVIGDGWETQTPCTEWDVRALVDHAVGVQKNVGGSLGLEAVDDADWAAVKSAMESLLGDPATLAGSTNHPAFGEVPKARMLGIAITDLLVHTWDLARAIGADETLPADAVAAGFEGLKQLPAEVIRAPERFGPSIDVADDADLQTQFLAFSGRQP